MECKYQDTVHVDNLELASSKPFKKGFEMEKTYWTYRSLYLSSAKQSPGKSVAALATRVEDLVAQCRVAR